MSIKCTIPGVSLKVFGRAIQSLSKIGDELYFEPREDGLFLRSVNSCRSAYACFQFSPSFFLHYVDASVQAETADEDTFRCKIGMKSVMTLFRNLPTIDKTVEKCRISLNTAEDRLVFQMYCRHGIIKTHKLAFIECETLQAVSPKDLCPNKITSLPKLLCDAVLNFQANQEEITIIVRPNFLALQNYIDDDQDPTKLMRTELTLSPDEFDQYQVGVDTDITFCLKELRAILSFADITNLPVTLHFEGAGRPITFSITGDLSYEATFVLATLAEVEGSLVPSNSQSQSHKAAKSGRKDQAQKQSCHQNGYSSAARDVNHDKNESRKKDLSQRSQRDEAGTSSYNRKSDECEEGMSTTLAVEDVSIISPASFVSHFAASRKDKDFNISQLSGANHEKGTEVNNEEETRLTNSCVENGSQDRSYRSTNRTVQKGEAHSVSDNGNSDSCDNRLVSTGHQPPSLLPYKRQGRVTTVDEYEERDVGSPVIPVQSADFSIADEVEEEEEDDVVPATPPSKKFRSVFFGTQSSTQPSQSQSKAEILAPDSDEGD